MESQFNQVVRDTINDLKNKGTGYCFSMEQLKEIQKHFKDTISYSFEDGIYYLKKKMV